jgi:hypothetical protein
MASKIAEPDKEFRFKWWWPYDPMPDIFIERLRPEELFALEKLRLQTEIKMIDVHPRTTLQYCQAAARHAIKLRDSYVRRNQDAIRNDMALSRRL